MSTISFARQTTKNFLIFVTSLVIILLITQAVFAQEDDSDDSDEASESIDMSDTENESETINTSNTTDNSDNTEANVGGSPTVQSNSISAFSAERINKNNNAYSMELNFSEIPIRPDIFLDDSLNQVALKIQNVNLALAKGFSLGDTFFLILNLRTLQGQPTSTEITNVIRKSSIVSYQGVAHFGFNIRSIMIDHASMHPFIGLGYYRSTFTDTYTYIDESTDYNKINETGSLAEIGINFIDQYSRLFSTFKMGKFMPSSKTYDSTMDPSLGTTALSINDAGSISTSSSSYYSVGFGIKF